MLKEFRDFAMKGNVLDLAVGIILGVAFGSIISSLVSDMLMPPIGLLFGNVDFSNLFFVLSEGRVPGPYSSVNNAIDAGAVTLNYGLFINTIVNFVIVAFAMFVLVRAVRRGEKKVDEAPKAKDCPYCFSSISINAKRCPFCTSKL
jgi:large conductance mechanosensitive channel